MKKLLQGDLSEIGRVEGSLKTHMFFKLVSDANHLVKGLDSSSPHRLA